uniref:ELYS-bb domain-containing protein n=1 Tax=Mesocestoides corti TaxID=53468 RepID=A0A5K3EZU7_MESCO
MQSVATNVCAASFDCEDLVLQPHSECQLGSASLTSSVDEEIHLPRFIFTPAGSITCVYSSSRLHCQFSSGKRFSWTPESSYKFFNSMENWPLNVATSWSIVEVAFLHSQMSTIIVLLTSPDGGGPHQSLVCLLKLNDAFIDVTRVISLRGKAHAIHVVTPNEQESSLSVPCIDQTFGGLVAIAMERGVVTLLDLCLDWQPRKPSLEPSVSVTIDQCLEAFVKHERISPYSESFEHSLINLNASRVSWNNFYYQTPGDKTIRKLPSTSVKVTLLRNVCAIKSLVVGFNFGGWQIWHLTDFQLIYTYPDLPSPPAPVVCCAFAEPSDDPRYCCYLWIGWQAPKRTHTFDASTLGRTAPEVSLFQLGFRKRTEHTQAGTEDTICDYDQLYGASKRLSACLTPLSSSATTSHWSPFGAQLQAIQPLSTNYSVNHGLRSNRLTALVWRAAPHIVRIGLFDLDQWYHAQMPSTIRSENPFFAVYDASLNASRTYPLSAHILPQTIFAFWANNYRRELRASKLCGDMTSSPDGKKSPLWSYRDLRKPLSELQLRPSTHSFDAFVPFIRDPGVVAYATLKFVSRQELALRELSAAIKSPSSSSFEANDWILEAVACSLIQEFEDPDYDIPRIMKETEDSEWLLRQALGLEFVPQDLQTQLELVEKDAEDECSSDDCVMSPRAGNKRPVAIVGGRSAKRGRHVVEKAGDHLSPTWVIIANCLLDHGMLREVKNLGGLISATDDTVDPQAFMRRWVWLRWLGRKTSFDELCCPIFSVCASSATLTSDKLSALSLCTNSLRQLAELAGSVYAAEPSSRRNPSVSAAASEAKLRVISMFAEYTRPVCLLLRLGLLPQASDTYSSSLRSRQSPLAPYDPTLIKDFLAKIQSSNGQSEPPFLTTHLLNHIFADENEETRGIWQDQEQPLKDGGSVAAFYPPRRLQSVCALWQSVDAPPPARLALLVFVLFDAIAVNAAFGNRLSAVQAVPPQASGRVQLSDGKTDDDLGPLARAAHLQEQVVSQILSLFPEDGKLLSSIQTLWLIDRFRFSEVLCSRLSPVVTGQMTSLNRLPEILPNQALLASKHCLSCGQVDLAALFTPHDSDGGGVDNTSAAGSPLLALHHARRLCSLKLVQDASSVILEAANKFRKCGRFLDFINLGLTAWEADVVFSDLRRRGDNRLLFACLVARAQYKEAYDLLKEADADISSRLSVATTQSSSSKSLSKSRLIRAMVSTITSCLPSLDHLTRFSALVNGNDEGDFSKSDDTSVEFQAPPSPPCLAVDSDSPRRGLPRLVATPKGRGLAFQPCTVERRQLAEFWDDFNLSQRVLRGENPFKTTSPTRPRITDSARNLSRNLRRMLYSASVDSPLRSRKQRVDLRLQSPYSSNTPTQKAPIEVGHRPVVQSDIDFWSKLGRMHENLGVTTASPTVSILKVWTVLVLLHASKRNLNCLCVL